MGKGRYTVRMRTSTIFRRLARVIRQNHVPMAAKNAQEQSLAEGVDKELTCALCLYRYVHPKVLPCLHSYCKGCLEKLAKKKRHPGQQPEITCPQCKEVHQIPPEGIDAFKTYFTINNLIELLRVHEAMTVKESAKHAATILCGSGVDENPAVAHCLTCSDHLCESCFTFHKKQRLTRDHNVVLLKDLQQLDKKTGIQSVRQKQRDIICEEHKEELLKLFCKTCQKVICRDCVLIRHREHKYEFVSECRPEVQKQLATLVKKTKKKQIEFKAHSKHLAKVRESKSAAFDAYKRELNTTFDNVVNALEARRKTLMKKLEGCSQTAEKKLNAETDYLELALARFGNSVQFTEKLLDSEDDIEMMLMSTQAKPALESLQQLKWDQKRVQFKSRKVAFDQTLLDECKQMGFICTPVEEDDIKICDLPATAKGTFSFELILSPCEYGADLAPLLSVKVASPTQMQVQVETIEKGFLTWEVLVTPTEVGVHTITIKVDTVVIEYRIDIIPLAAGMKVVRGPDWEYSDEDGGAGTVGEVIKITNHENYPVHVKWPNGETVAYRWGYNLMYDLKAV